MARLPTDAFRWRQVLVLGLVAVGLSVLGSPQITRRVDRYVLGEFTTQAIRAPYDLSIVDDEATRQQRAAAAARAPVVANVDRGVAAALLARFASALAPIDEALTAAEPDEAPPTGSRARSAAAEAARKQRRTEAVRQALLAARPEAERRLGIAIPDAVVATWTERARVTELTEAFSRLTTDAYRRPLAADTASLRELAATTDDASPAPPVALVDPSGTEAQVDLGQIGDLSQARAGLAGRARELLPDAPPEVAAWLADVSGTWLRPSVVPNEAATLARRNAAARAVLPVSVTFSRNQLIVGEGEPVTRQALLALDALRQQRLDAGVWRRLAARTGVILAILLLAYWAGWHRRGRRAVDPGHFPYLVTSLVATAITFRLWLEMIGSLGARYPGLTESAMVLAFPATAGVMYARVVLPFTVAAAYMVVQAVCLGLLWQIDLLYVIYLLTAGAVGGRLVARCSGRECVMRAGLLSGLVVAPIAACLALLDDATGAAVLVTTGGAVLGCALSGLAMLAVGPLFEWAFGHMTRTRLVELMNYEHPLLRRVTELTPGTFQHSVTIGLLADAAAAAIDADGLLARVGALYHDAGKTERPDCFVENQHGVNPHDTMPPLESARAIIDHVPAGVRLVRKFGLGERVADFVREHHGTSTVRYFLNKAEGAGTPVDPGDFRYPGPRPQSRETGILMIADQVEATARAMDEPTEDDLRAMVRATIERIEGEQQLDECPLTLQELSTIREAFVQVLAGVHHRRIKYPGVSLTPASPPVSPTVP